MNNGSVSTSGSNARAASILGGSGTITNNGSLSTTGAAGQTVYMQGNNDHLINTGTITASGAVAGGVSPDAVFSNTAGSSFTALIENRAGGKIISQNGSGIRTLNGNTTIINAGLVQSGVGTAITMGNGNDSLILQTGSVINGTADGGAGSNTVTLQGSGTASNAFTNFQTLLMQGDLWNWTGSGTFTLAHVQTGTLNLSGTLSVSASAIVDGGATLQANAQNLPQSVTDNGLVRLAQDNASTYAGLISGTGAVEKTGAGVLTLEPAAAGGNTYSGGTTITQGTVAIAADNALGAASGGLTFNGGALQLNQALNLAGTRAMSITASGGTIDTQAFSTAISQGITGAGALTKAGTGTLVTTGTNTYAGGTTIANGTLQLGSGGASGSLVGNVANNGSLVFNRSDNVAFPGIVSGSGSLTQAGAGTTLLTANNPYTGATTVAAGTLAIGDAQHANAALSGGGAVGVASGATLGGYGSVTGNVTNAGTIAVADALPAFASSGSGTFTINGTLTNAGLAAVGGAGVGNRLNVAGSYVGKNSTIALNTVVAGDNAASDRMVISGSTSTATGTSALKITNVGGLGAATLANGIQVIEANNGATTDLSAFRLASPVEVGAYSYYLAKGGVSNGTAQNWYLRNTVPVAATPNPAPPSTPVPPTTPTPPTTPSPPPTQSLPVNPSLPPSADNPIVPADMPIAAPSTQPEVITALAQAANAPSASLSASAPAPAPVYRPEAPVYAAIPMVARQINIQQIDTFHDRQGEQSLLDESGTLPAAWGRVWGGHTVQSQDGALNPEFDGSIYGAQAGHDVYADSTPGGHRNHYGFFVGFTRVTGDVNGYALATPNLDVGHLAINGYSLGAYWTHIGPSGWYTNAVLMGTSLTIDPLSNNGVGATTHGRAVSGSVETGLPIPLAHGLSIEPQAQLIWQNLSINDLNDGVSTVSFKHGNTFLGRLGVRLEGTYTNSVATWQPYLRFSVLRNFGAGDDVTFGGATTLPGSVGQTAGQIGAGLVAKVGKSSSAYATLSYLSNLGGSHQRTITGNAGVRWSW